eukprot:2882837-Prymnesium_polylepis.1
MLSSVRSWGRQSENPLAHRLQRTAQSSLAAGTMVAPLAVGEMALPTAGPRQWHWPDYPGR